MGFLLLHIGTWLFAASSTLYFIVHPAMKQFSSLLAWSEIE